MREIISTQPGLGLICAPDTLRIMRWYRAVELSKEHGLTTQISNTNDGPFNDGRSVGELGL